MIDVTSMGGMSPTAGADELVFELDVTSYSFPLCFRMLIIEADIDFPSIICALAASSCF